MSTFIYQPKGRAREYALWACNLHAGCSNGCDYCYCKRGALSRTMGSDTPRLKKGVRDEAEAFEVFKRELFLHREAIIRDGGLFFSFSTDPCLPENASLTFRCIVHATEKGVPCLLLTKCTDWVDSLEAWSEVEWFRDNLRVGFTLTGCDEHEEGAPSNLERIEAMRKAHGLGFRTFASVEPVIDFDRATEMFRLTEGICDAYKTGLISGVEDAYRDYDMPARLKQYVEDTWRMTGNGKIPVYYKDSIKKEFKKYRK